MIQSLNEIKQVSGRDLDGQVDDNTLIAGETSAGVFGVFKFLPAVKNAVKNFFVGIAKATVASTTKIAVVKDDGTIEYISADDVLAYKNAKEETIAGKKIFTGGIVADVEGENINAENVNATEVNTTNVTATGAIKGVTAEVDSLTVSNSADLPNYYKKTETYSKSEIDGKILVKTYSFQTSVSAGWKALEIADNIKVQGKTMIGMWVNRNDQYIVGDVTCFAELYASTQLWVEIYSAGTATVKGEIYIAYI